MAVQVELGFLVDHSVSSRKILAQNTRKLPHLAWGPNIRKTGRRQQEWANKQRPPSVTGSSLQDAMGDSSEEKPRNGHGTNLELPGTASEGSQKGTGTNLALPSLPTHPHTKQGLGVEGPPSPSVGWCHPTKKGWGEGEGAGGDGGLDLGPQITRCMLSDRHEEACR